MTEDSKPIAIETVLKASHSWNGPAYEAYPSGQPMLTVLRIVIPPHTPLPWHYHVVPNAAYIISGKLTVEDQASGKTSIFRAGDAFAESVNTIHRGFSDDETTVVIVTYAGSPDQALSIKADGKQEH